MKAYKRSGRVLWGVLALFACLWAADFTAHATPPMNIAFTPIGRATVPEFDIRRRFRVQPEDQVGSGHDRGQKKFWKLEMEAGQPIDVATQIVTFQPGGFSGWHSHPGPVFFTVKSGTLTVYEGDDPSCTPFVFPSGTGAVEAGTNTHIHMVRNETGIVAEALVTYLVPVGTPQSALRTDLPNPGNCPF
jgi:hypothetical protein